MITKTDFINRVMLIMNEAGMTDIQGNSFIGANSAGIDKYIEGSYENAWRLLAAVPTLPKAWLTNKTFKDYPLVMNLSQGKGFVVLPDDFYMLSAFRMNGWVKDIFDASVENEMVSAIQSNPYTQGSTLRPVGTISNEYVDDAPPSNNATVQFLGTTAISTGGVSWIDTNCYLESAKKFYHEDELLSYLGSYVAATSYVLDNAVLSGGKIWRAAQSVVGELPGTTNKWIEVIGELPQLSKTYTDASGNRYIGSKLGLIKLSDAGFNQVLNYYTVQKGLTTHSIDKALYVPKVLPLTAISSGDAVLSLDDKIIEPMAYVCAACVFTILQKDALATSLTEKGLLMIPGYKSIRGNNVTVKQ